MGFVSLESVSFCRTVGRALAWAGHPVTLGRGLSDGGAGEGPGGVGCSGRSLLWS